MKAKGIAPFLNKMYVLVTVLNLPGWLDFNVEMVSPTSIRLTTIAEKIYGAINPTLKGINVTLVPLSDHSGAHYNLIQ